MNLFKSELYSLCFRSNKKISNYLLLNNLAFFV